MLIIAKLRHNSASRTNILVIKVTIVESSFMHILTIFNMALFATSRHMTIRLQLVV